MDEDGFGYIILWNTCSEVSSGDMVFKFITGNTFGWDCVLWYIFAMLV